MKLTIVDVLVVWWDVLTIYMYFSLNSWIRTYSRRTYAMHRHKIYRVTQHTSIFLTNGLVQPLVPVATFPLRKWNIRGRRREISLPDTGCIWTNFIIEFLMFSLIFDVITSYPWSVNFPSLFSSILAHCVRSTPTRLCSKKRMMITRLSWTEVCSPLLQSENFFVHPCISVFSKRNWTNILVVKCSVVDELSCHLKGGNP